MDFGISTNKFLQNYHKIIVSDYLWINGISLNIQY